MFFHKKYGSWLNFYRYYLFCYGSFVLCLSSKPGSLYSFVAYYSPQIIDYQCLPICIPWTRFQINALFCKHGSQTYIHISLHSIQCNCTRACSHAHEAIYEHKKIGQMNCSTHIFHDLNRVLVRARTSI